MSDIIDLDSITKAYGRQKVLDNVSLRLPSGKFMILVGRNGVGKSTLMRIIARRDFPTSGTGSVLGAPLEADVSGDAKDFAYVAEDFEIRLGGTLDKFVAYYSRAFPRWDAGLFARFIASAGLALDRPFATLSRGQRMQFAFALALARRPKLFILDEITAVLDADVLTVVLAYLRASVADGASALLSTNIVTEVTAAADLRAVLAEGKLTVEALS